MKCNKKVIAVITGTIMIGGLTWGCVYQTNKKEELNKANEMVDIVTYYNDHKVDILFEDTLSELIVDTITKAYTSDTTNVSVDLDLLSEAKTNIDDMNNNFNKVDLDFIKEVYLKYDEDGEEKYKELMREYTELKIFIDAINNTYEPLEDGVMDYWDVKLINQGLSQMNLSK